MLKFPVESFPITHNLHLSETVEVVKRAFILNQPTPTTEIIRFRNAVCRKFCRFSAE